MLEKILKPILKKKLIKDRWYLGRGRNNNVGYWNGEYFITLGKKFNHPNIKYEPYANKKLGCFQPFYLLDEGEIIEPFGEIGWDKHYGKKLKLRLE